MSFTGNEDHSITLEEASELTQNYRDNAESGAKKGGYFSKESLLDILNQDECVGIRYYFGEEDDGTPVLVLVGVDEEENDLTNGALREKSTPCPPRCGQANDLNS